MRRSLKQQKPKAYTLVEVIVTVVILTIGFLGIFSSINYSRQDTRVSDKKLRAANYGRQLLENLRAKIDSRTWGAWDLACDGGAHDWPGASFEGRAVSYTCTDHDSGARQVTVTVFWNNP